MAVEEVGRAVSPMFDGGSNQPLPQALYGAFSDHARRRIAVVLLASVSGSTAYAAAFTSFLPIAGLALPVVALALAKGRGERFVVALSVQVALWSHVPVALVAYGVEPAFAFGAAVLGALGHAVLLAVLPPWASVPLWACSPFAFGHPWFALLSVLPVGLSAWGVGAALVLSCMVGHPRTALGGGFTLGLLLMAVNIAAEGVRQDTAAAQSEKVSALVGVDTEISGRALLAVTDWEVARGAVMAALSEARRPPLAILLPEGVISKDPTRADHFFEGLAEHVGVDLFIGVDHSGEQVIRHYPASEAVSRRDVYVQVQGVPFLTGAAAAVPWRYFEQAPLIAPDGTSLRFMICYELFLPLPWLAARLGLNGVAIAASDDWGMPASVAVARAKLISAMGDRNSTITAINNRRDVNGNLRF
jgi:hypothetical protein